MSIFSNEFEKEIVKIVNEKHKEITEKDIKKIIKELLPDIDKIISDKIKKHFVELAKHIEHSFK